MEQRDKKRLIIGSIYVVIFILILIPIIFKLIPNGTCSDGKQNQDEKGIDCGGVCQNFCAIQLDDSIVYKSVGFTETGVANRYDIYGEILNPNKDYGSSSFDYIFDLKDASGTSLSKRGGTSFIFPGEKKYIVELGVDLSARPAKIELEIKNIAWKDFSGVQKPQLSIVNKSFNETDQDSGLSDAIGILRNESPFDFNEIKVQAIIKDKDEKIIALNSTKINTVQSGENREFKFLWTNKIVGAGNMEIQVETNIFKNDAFVSRYFPGQSF
jgi:hypothetical protein